MTGDEKRGIVAVILAGICWGMIGIFTRKLSEYGYNSIQISFLRNLFAALELFIFILIKKRQDLKISIKDIWMFIGTGICSVAMFNVCYFKTIELTTMSTAAILLYTAPGMVMLMSCLFFKEKITAKKILALVMAFLGCILITQIYGNTPVISISGLLVGLLSGFGYALYSIFGTVATRKYNTLTITFYTFLLAAIGLLPFSDVGGSFDTSLFDVRVLLVALLLATISTVIPFMCYTIGLRKIEAGRASVIAFTEPMVATLIGITVFQEKMTLMNIMGILLIFVSIVLLNLNGKSK